MKNLILAILIIVGSASQASAQIFGRIMDRATDKVTDHLADKMADIIADEIAKAAMRPIDKALDDMMRERYVQDSINGNTEGRDYSSYMNAFLTPVDLPESYTFDMILDIETTGYDKDKSEMQLMLSTSASILGIVQPAEEEYTMIVLDNSKNIMAMYGEEDGKRKVLAMPSMLSEATLIAASQATADDSDPEEYSFELTGKTKTIHGYKCEEFKFEDETNKGKGYIAKEFPVSWEDYFASMMTYMAPTTNRASDFKGMVMVADTKTKKKGKKSSYKVTKISEVPFTIENSSYEKMNYADK